MKGGHTFHAGGASWEQSPASLLSWPAALTPVLLVAHFKVRPGPWAERNRRKGGSRAHLAKRLNQRPQSCAESEVRVR